MTARIEERHDTGDDTREVILSVTFPEAYLAIAAFGLRGEREAGYALAVMRWIARYAEISVTLTSDAVRSAYESGYEAGRHSTSPEPPEAP